VLFTALGITSYAPSGVSAAAINGLTVLSAIQIASVQSLPDIACSGAFVSPTGGCAAFTFTAPTVSFATILAGAGITLGNSAGLNLTANTVAVMIEDGTPDFTTANPFATASDGDLRLVVDLDSTKGDFWSAVGPTVLSDFMANTVGVGIGSFSLDLTITGQAFTGWDMGPDFTGRGNLSRAEPTAASPVGGDATFFMFGKVPEPGSLALAGLALLGLGVASRRKA
jgi:hypothetical protein